MQRYIYTIGIHLYILLIRVATLFNNKAKKFIEGRKNWKSELQNLTKGKSNWIWIHCSSLGEFEQGRPVIEKIKKDYPEKLILLSFFSPSGYEIRKNYDLADAVMYMPADFIKNAKRFIDILNPDAALFIKYEYWYNHLHQLYKRKIPVFLISAAFTEDHVFFKWYGSFFRRILKFYDTIFIQDTKSQKLLESISCNNYMLAGDTRFDRVYEITQEDYSSEMINRFVESDKKIIVAGSTWRKDEELLNEFLGSHNSEYKLIIAPHDVSDGRIESVLALFEDFRIKLFVDDKTEKATDQDYDILVINTIGLLSKIYRYANIAYVGGGFNKGIHNILEAACYKLPVIFGPNYSRFKEATELIEIGGAYSISDIDEFRERVLQLSENQEIRKMGELSFRFVKKNLGSTSKILDILKKNDVL